MLIYVLVSKCSHIFCVKSIMTFQYSWDVPLFGKVWENNFCWSGTKFWPNINGEEGFWESAAYPARLHSSALSAQALRARVLRARGGGLNPRPNGLGHFFIEKNFPSSKGHFIDFGGGLTLAWMVWGIYAVKIEVNMGICLCSERVLRLATMLCALMYRHNGNLANLLKKARKKCAPDCPFECV